MSSRQALDCRECVSVEGRFQAIMAVLMPCRSDRSAQVGPTWFSSCFAPGHVSRQPGTVDVSAKLSRRQLGVTHAQQQVTGLLQPLKAAPGAQGLAPFGHLADGRLHLVLVKACSRLQFLRFLASIPSRGGRPCPAEMHARPAARPLAAGSGELVAGLGSFHPRAGGGMFAGLCVELPHTAAPLALGSDEHRSAAAGSCVLAPFQQRAANRARSTPLGPHAIHQLAYSQHPS